MAVSRTHTRVHTEITFANPYQRCMKCKSWVTGWHNAVVCGCNTEDWNLPCECRSHPEDVCPSWGPVDGCTCLETLGSAEHDEPPQKDA